MKKSIILVSLLFAVGTVAHAEGALNMSGQIINSRIFSTQAAHQH